MPTVRCPAGTLVSSEPGVCLCRIARTPVHEREDAWSFENLCTAQYTACAVWRDERDSLDEHGVGVLKQMERDDAKARDALEIEPGRYKERVQALEAARGE